MWRGFLISALSILEGGALKRGLRGGGGVNPCSRCPHAKKDDPEDESHSNDRRDGLQLPSSEERFCRECRGRQDREDEREGDPKGLRVDVTRSLPDAVKGPRELTKRVDLGQPEDWQDEEKPHGEEAGRSCHEDSEKEYQVEG